MTADKEVLRKCKQCEHADLWNWCNREVAFPANEFTGTKIDYVAHRRIETNADGNCPHFKPKPSFWTWLKEKVK